MKSVVALLLGVLLALSYVSAQYSAPPPAYSSYPAPPSGEPQSEPLKGECGMYLSACCEGSTCNRGFVCTSGLAATDVCFTPRCSDTQQCMEYAYWTECITSQMNCNACGFIGQKTCSLQSGPIERTEPCYQGYPENGYCVGEVGTPPAPEVYYPPYPTY